MASEAWRVMTNGDPEGRIFLSYPHTNNGFLNFLAYRCFFIKNKLPEVPEYAKIQFHMMINNQYPVPEGMFGKQIGWTDRWIRTQ